MNPLHPMRYLHTIHAAPDCQRLRQIYMDLFGGIVFHEGYYAPEDRDAALLYVADHMIEVMAPRDPDDLNYMYARYLQKTGPSFHSISFGIADVAAAQARCRELGVLISTEGPGLIFLHPKSTGGIIMEITDNMMPNDPWDLPNWRRDWASGRPDRPHALAHVVCAPRNATAAVAFLVNVLDGEVQGSETVDWPERAKATAVKVADITLLVLEPEDGENGPLASFAASPNSGVYALAWNVTDPKAAATHLGDNHTAKLSVHSLAAGAQYTHELLLDGARHWFVRQDHED